MSAPIQNSQQSDPFAMLSEKTTQAISRYFKDEDKNKEVEEMSKEIHAAVLNIYNQIKETGKAKYGEIDSKSWVPLERQMKWIVLEFDNQGYVLNSSIDFERIGPSFIEDKVNSSYQSVANITSITKKTAAFDQPK